MAIFLIEVIVYQLVQLTEVAIIIHMTFWGEVVPVHL